jgi:cyclophilin family peptidyl-prolyl cis-trans isomerase
MHAIRKNVAYLLPIRHSGVFIYFFLNLGLQGASCDESVIPFLQFVHDSDSWAGYEAGSCRFGAMSNMSFPRFFASFTLGASLLLASPIAQAQAPVVATPAPVATPTADLENILYLDLSTGGRVAIQLYPATAPAHVERIKTLTRRGFYNGIIFHRVIEGFMAQTGDPTGTGEGDSDLPDLKAEFNPTPHLRGTVSMARTNDPDTANSQFFICFLPRFALDNKYTVFGRVISGMPFVDGISRGEPPVSPDRIVQASIAADNLPPPVIAPRVVDLPKIAVDTPAEN